MDPVAGVQGIQMAVLKMALDAARQAVPPSEGAPAAAAMLQAAAAQAGRIDRYA